MEWRFFYAKISLKGLFDWYGFGNTAETNATGLNHLRTCKLARTLMKVCSIGIKCQSGLVTFGRKPKTFSSSLQVSSVTLFLVSFQYFSETFHQYNLFSSLSSSHFCKVLSSSSLQSVTSSFWVNFLFQKRLFSLCPLDFFQEARHLLVFFMFLVQLLWRQSKKASNTWKSREKTWRL